MSLVIVNELPKSCMGCKFEQTFHEEDYTTHRCGIYCVLDTWAHSRKRAKECRLMPLTQIIIELNNKKIKYEDVVSNEYTSEYAKNVNEGIDIAINTLKNMLNES